MLPPLPPALECFWYKCPRGSVRDGVRGGLDAPLWGGVRSGLDAPDAPPSPPALDYFWYKCSSLGWCKEWF